MPNSMVGLYENLNIYMIYYHHLNAFIASTRLLATQ